MKKSSVNIHKRRTVVITVIFDDKSRILLTKKKQPDSVFLHGKWQLLGLGMKRDETHHQTMKRIKEEFGVDFKPTTFEPIESIVYRNKNAYTTLHIFACKTDFLLEHSRRPNQNLSFWEATTSPESGFWPSQNDNLSWLKYEDIDPSDCTPLTFEIIEITLKVV